MTVLLLSLIGGVLIAAVWYAIRAAETKVSRPLTAPRPVGMGGGVTPDMDTAPTP